MDLEAGVPRGTEWVPQPTLGSDYYCADDVWELEKERIFYDEWFAIGREEEIPSPNDYFVRSVANESVIVVRGKDGSLRAHYNVCAHRGTKLCDEGTGVARSGVFKCPYHAWTYNTDGVLVGTPNVHEEEGFEKATRPLWSMAVDSWQGYVFVNMAEGPTPLMERLDHDSYEPRAFERYGMDELRIGERIVYETAANWKIVLENFNECLHCPSVHPELAQMVPIFRKGRVEERPGWWGNTLIDGATTLTPSGTSDRPPIPGLAGEDLHAYYGFHLFPNLLLNFHSDCVMTYRLEPHGPGHTTIVSEYLFPQGTIADPGFDPSDIVGFWDLVSKQDWDVCERAQTGVGSRAFRDGGVYPWNDHLLHEFNEIYLARLRG